jgi:hypothetical protein
MSRGSRNLLLLHLAANALLLWLAYEWLSVDESSTGKLALSSVDAAAILTLWVWLHSATLVFFRLGAAPRINDAFRMALRHLPLLVLGALLALGLYAMVSQAQQATAKPAFQFASWLTMTLRKPVKPAAVTRMFQAAFWILRWAVLPALLLPLASALAGTGWRGWREISGRRSLRYWILVPLLTACGLWLPFVILGWKPRMSSFELEATSFTVRAVVSYLLAVGALLALAVATSRGRPLFSHEITVPKP